MQHNAAFHQGLHCLQRLKQPSWTEVQHNLEISTYYPLNVHNDSPILIVSICMGKPIRVQRVNCIEKRIVSHYFEVVVVLIGIF